MKKPKLRIVISVPNETDTKELFEALGRFSLPGDPVTVHFDYGKMSPLVPVTSDLLNPAKATT